MANSLATDEIYRAAIETAGRVGKAGFVLPVAIAVDSSGNLYIADYANNR